jgi:hypothetical protein
MFKYVLPIRHPVSLKKIFSNDFSTQPLPKNQKRISILQVAVGLFLEDFEMPLHIVLSAQNKNNITDIFRAIQYY